LVTATVAELVTATREAMASIPSLDLRYILKTEQEKEALELQLFAPEDTFLDQWHCSLCGGHLEIVSRETKRVRIHLKLSV
jgi:hypothetical protein